MAIFTNDQAVTATVKFTDKKGKPDKVDGVPVWASDNADVAVVTAADDGMSASIVSGDLTGEEPWTANITCTADADLGEGVVQLIGTGSITYTGGQAVVSEITFTPTP